MKFLPLVMVFVLAAIAVTAAHTLPAAKGSRAIGLLLDFIPLASVVAVTVIATIRLKRASVPLNRLVIAISSYFAGALVGMGGLAHLVAVVLAAIDRARKHEFIYDFRFYSLIQLGLFLLAAGLIAAIEAATLAQGRRDAWRTSVLVWVAILVINVALVPIQGFAILFSVFAALELLLLIGMRRHFAVESGADTRVLQSAG